MLTDFLNSIIEHLLLLKFISLLISTVLLGFTIYFTIKINVVSETFEHYVDVLSSKGITHRRGTKGWRQIQKQLNSGEESEFKAAILEADRILNDILKMAGYPGVNLDERLAQMTSAQLPNIEEISQVHKLHNKIVSDSNFPISEGEARSVIGIYKKAFQDLELIEE